MQAERFGDDVRRILGPAQQLLQSCLKLANIPMMHRNLLQNPGALELRFQNILLAALAHAVMRFCNLFDIPKQLVMPLEDRKATLDRSFKDEMWSKDGMISRAAWDTGSAVVRDAGILKSDIKYDEIIDMSFVESVRTSL